MKPVKSYEDFVSESSLDESVKSAISNALKKGSEFAKDVWFGVKRESRETQEAARLVGELMKGNQIEDVQKKFLKAQAVDLVKALPLIAIQGIPVPVPITPFLILLGKKVGFDILPNSHTKVDYIV